jgi:ABC-type multidrug transport system fused ATPase/permease subunit
MTATEAETGHNDQISGDEATTGDDIDVVAVLNADVREVKAMEVLRRGLAISPGLRAGAYVTVLMALAQAAGRLSIPILIQQVLDRGISSDEGLRMGFVLSAAAIALAVIALVYVAGWITYNRLVRVAEKTLADLRVDAFAHLQRLSLADHVASRKGVLTARVTSDVETLSQFAQWGAIAWIINSIVIVGTIIVMAVYSPVLTVVTVLVYLPLIPILRRVQRRQFTAYGVVRERVGRTLGAASEAVAGAAVIRAYGYRDQVRANLAEANDEQFRAQIFAHKFFAWLAPLTDGFSALALSAVVAVGVWTGPGADMSSGELVAFLFLVTLLINPIAEIGEILDQTQTALAGWWRILQVLDVPVEIVEPEPGIDLEPGPLAVQAVGLQFAYRTGGPVLHGVDVDIPAGTSVAVVGETGSGKTTFAKLLARFADPTDGAILVNGVDLRAVSSRSRHRGIRMVPQDGFLFDTTVGANVAFGRTVGAGQAEPTGADIEAAFDALDLRWWLDRLPAGLDTPVGERGESLSVGERQLVALARAQLADPGLLILDEATSAVDPETEVALASALDRLAQGRTTISIAHRLSTAERADLVLVFDAGRIVEQGSHDELVAAGGTYAGLHASWVGNTR